MTRAQAADGAGDRQDDSFNIAVVGAGPAGLMLVLRILANGNPRNNLTGITVFEREAHHDHQPRANADRSYTIDITGHGRKAIASVGTGLLARFDRELIPFRGVQAHILGRLLPYAEGGWTGSRGDICSALLHELEMTLPSSGVPCDFRWRSEVTTVKPDTGTVHWKQDGQAFNEDFDLVVGADGAGSLFRKTLENDQYLTTTRSSIPNFSRILHLDTGDASKAFDPALLHMFGLRPWAVGGAILDDEAARQTKTIDAAKLPKDFYVQMGYWKETPVGTPDEIHAVLSRIRVKPAISETPTTLAGYVSAEEVDAYSKRAVHHTGRTVICSQLSGGRCVLLGDAATAFPPVGQGVNAALEAASLLGERIANADRPGLDAALASYNESWLPEARACAEIANQVIYGSRLNMIRMLVLGALSDLTGIEMVAPQLAKDARYSYRDALAVTRRRERSLYAINGILLLALVLAL